MKRHITQFLLTAVLLISCVVPSGACSSDDTDLRGTAWQAVSINGTPVIAGSYLSLYLFSDGYLSGYAGINFYDSRWKAEGNNINFIAGNTSGGITMVGGPENFEEQETAYIKRLWSASTFTIRGHKLHLFDAEGIERIVFKPIPTYPITETNLVNTAWHLETINGRAITDNSSARLTIYENGIAYCQAGALLANQHFCIEDNFIRPVAGGGIMRTGATNEYGMAHAAIGAFGAGTVEIKGQALRTLTIDGTTATFTKFRSAYTFDPNPPVLNTASGSPSWAVMPEDITEVIADSDLIVMGTGIGYLGMEEQPGSRYITQFDWKSVFRVDAVFNGTCPEEIVLTHPVDRYPDGSFHFFFNSNPPVMEGERWILFLRRHDDGTYTEFGPWGRFKITDEKVYSMNRVTGDDNDYYARKLDINGENTWTFLRSLQHTLSASSLTFHNLRNELLSHGFGIHTSGLTGTREARFSTGWSVSGTVTFTIRRVDGQDSGIELPMLDGVDIRMEPSSLSVEPDREYSLTLRADT
ncbi:MAG: META domain-containing protein, partial [Dehalococcoidales bacterium]|nr:META domain-containing protein [Dehalococcoidales bacterium]